MGKDQTNGTSQKATNKSVRPALITSRRTVTEYSTLLERLLLGLADESIPVALVCPPDCDVDSLLCGTVDVIRYPAIRLPPLWLQNRNSLAQQLSGFRPSVLHCLCESRASLTKHLAGRLGVPYVLTVNSLQQGRRHLRISPTHCARIIVPARTIANDIAKTRPALAERIEQINFGTFVEEDCRCFGRHSRLPSMVATHPLDHVRDFEDLFGAARQMVISGYEFMLVLIGAGRAERQLRKLLAALDLLQTVSIVPKLRPWRSVLAAGDIFIQPRPSFAFNSSLLEAMSVGTAVAACKGGVDDLIVDGQTAVVFDPNDELSIRGSLQRLFDRREFARKLARAAQQYVRENHSVSNMVSAVLQTYYQAQQWFNR
jgi:glycosyltransferase involved in cell wall biosynthesis